ncbi:hypothetical protein, partial [Acetobacter orientalis]|uniref:hypothetical protein n=1 Tax=Acetobacter orientalis TaxID=146474 RepID=UPI0039E954CE
GHRAQGTGHRAQGTGHRAQGSWSVVLATERVGALTAFVAVVEHRGNACSGKWRGLTALGSLRSGP